MKTGKKGIDLIKSFEGCRLDAYLDIGGVPTIGWGRTKGVKKGSSKVELGDKITQKEADDYLMQDIAVFERRVNDHVKVKINQDMFDALVTFDYNTGGLVGSTLLKLLNQDKYSEASDQFLRWVYVINPKTKKKEVSNGLVRRRKEEQKLFRSGN